MKTVRIQGVFVSVRGTGVLIRGPAGCGKSLAALKLMRRGHQLVSDDLVEFFSCDDKKLVGRGVEPAVRIEVRGLGIYRATQLFDLGTTPQAQLDLIVDLDVYDPVKDAGRTSPETTLTRILGVDLTTVRVPVASGMDAALIIELLANAYQQGGTVEPS